MLETITEETTVENEVNISLLIKNGTPFSVIKYYEWFIMRPGEQKRKFDLIYLDKFNSLSTVELHGNDLDIFKKNKSSFQLKKENKDGAVYEFNDFKNHHAKNKLNWYLLRRLTPVKDEIYTCRDHYELYSLKWNGSYFVDPSTGISNKKITYVVLNHLNISEVTIKVKEINKDICSTPSTSELERILPQIEKLKLVFYHEDKCSRSIALKGLKDTRTRTIKQKIFKPKNPIQINVKGTTPQLIIPEGVEIDTEFFDYEFEIKVVTTPLKIDFKKIDFKSITN